MTTIQPARARALYMFVIYEHPPEYPECYVVRRSRIGGGAGISPHPDPEPWAVVDTLEKARDTLPDGAHTNLGRYLADEPQIVETWI